MTCFVLSAYRSMLHSIKLLKISINLIKTDKIFDDENAAFRNKLMLFEDEFYKLGDI